MPYLEPATRSLPYQSGSDTSREGARAARRHATTQRELMASIYRDNPLTGVTDATMSYLTGLPVNVVTARRNELKAIRVGTRMGCHGVRVTAWALGEADRG